MSYYPKPREWQFRDEYPVEDSHSLLNDYSPDFYWDEVGDDATASSEGTVKTPEEFEKEVKNLRERFGNKNNEVNMFDKI